MGRYSIENWGQMQNEIYAKGIITSVDSENDLADVTVDGYQNGTDIPIYYHCDPESEEQANGSIKGGAAAFGVDDEVIVMCTKDGVPVRIIGFVDGIKSCGFRFKIIWEHDNHVVTDAMTFEDDYWHAEDFGWGIPSFNIRSNKGSSTVFFGDEDWWTEYGLEEDWGPWEDYHENGLYAQYDPVSQYWTVPIPEEVRDADGYVISVTITYSINTQFLMPSDYNAYRYLWKTGPNESGLPYIGQKDGEGKYLYPARPGTYDFYVPYFRITGTTMTPNLEYPQLETVPFQEFGVDLPSRYGSPSTYLWTETGFMRTISWEGSLPCRAWEQYTPLSLSAMGYAGCQICQAEDFDDPCYPEKLGSVAAGAEASVIGQVLNAPGGDDYVAFSVGSSGTLTMTTNISITSSFTTFCLHWLPGSVYELIYYTGNFSHFHSKRPLSGFGQHGVGIDYS